MKKTIIIFIIAVLSIAFTSCSVNAEPTAKKTSKEDTSYSATQAKTTSENDLLNAYYSKLDMLNIKSSKVSSYVNGETEFSYNKKIIGNIAAEIYDFDGDKHSEMLLITSEIDNDKKEYHLCASMYECENGKVVLSDKIKYVRGSDIDNDLEKNFSTMDTELNYLNIFIKKYNNDNLICFDYKGFNVYYDGGICMFTAFLYDGNHFTTKATNYLAGSGDDDFGSGYLKTLKKVGIKIDDFTKFFYSKETVVDFVNKKVMIYSQIPAKSKDDYLKEISSQANNNEQKFNIEVTVKTAYNNTAE